ncbi:uncharacterized protein [Arachis hypogaea]|uniref:uncharacterized protein isoform X2 n=1 Tax=Arachis hypogaea TaxID=3818 RepID=UPI003B21ED6E
MWAATWLYMATRKPAYLKYIQEESISASVTEFNWDLKYAGAQIFLTKLKMGICNQDAVKQLQSMMENEHASENEIDIVLSVPEYSDYFEESICKCAFDLILISLGHKENVTVTQVKQYCEMESHEEKLHRQMREDKIREAKDEMKRKANEIDKNKIGYSKVDILCSESGKQRIILMDQKSQEASILPSSLRSSRKNEAIHKLGC